MQRTHTRYTLGANLENLTLTGTAAINGTGNTLNNTLTGNGANNTLTSGDGNDTLNGGDGFDTLIGGNGNDIYIVDSSTDSISEAASAGTDTVQSTVGYTLGDNLENLTLTGTTAIDGAGNTLNNTLTGNDANNILTGADGVDTLIGGAGDDTYIVNTAESIIEAASSGTDTVQAVISYTLGANLENLTLTGTAAINGTGNTLNNTLTGNEANNTLTGGDGVDTLIGGAGDDTYIIDTTTDSINEALSAGTDTVQSAVSYILGDNLENLTLTGTTAINGTGNTLNNILTGNGVNNTLNGGDGVDTLIGGLGNDIYVVDSSTDSISEGASAGTDTVQSAVSYTLGANLENLTLTGTTAIDGTGNTLNNILTGNDANNILNGGDGVDTLIGGAGDDMYIVNITTDSISEVATGGTDTVQSAVSYTLGANLENLTLTGTPAINGTGNTLNNILTGNVANNTLTGGTGFDTLIGGAGDDTYIVDTTTDSISEAAASGTDTVQSAVSYILGDNLENLTLTGTTAINGTGNTLNNTLTGNGANNTLNGGDGVDTLIGGLGNDIYVVDRGTDSISEGTTAGTDTVQSTVSYTLADNLENLTLTGTTAIDGTGNTLNNTLTGNDANNILTGADGVDTLVGAGGNDNLMGGLGNDSLTGGAGADCFSFNTSTEGVDTIRDFVVADDTIYVSAAGFNGGLTAGTLITDSQLVKGAGATTATDSTQRFIYNTTNGALFFDADGNGIGSNAVQIATLTGNPSITNADIFVTA